MDSSYEKNQMRETERQGHAKPWHYPQTREVAAAAADHRKNLRRFSPESAVIETAKILCRTPKIPHLADDPSLDVLF